MKYYIIYEITKDKEGNIVDINNKYDSSNLQDIGKWLDMDYKNINKYTAKDIDHINCKLKENKYFVLKEYE